jgi:broad specificity phosphatase PhoE
MKIIFLFVTLATYSLCHSQTLSDEELILQTLNKYIDGFYKGNAALLKASLKPRLYKFGFLKNKETGTYEYYEHMNYDQAIAFVEKMKAEGRSRDEQTIRKAEILDIGNHIASAKITAVWGMDYVLLSKDGGQWMIEEVIWEGPYQKNEKLNATTTYYLIRHAEKERIDSSNKDPKLTEQGLKRAQKWSEIFQDIPLDAIYSTNYKRTMQTASPTAEAKQLNITTYDPNKMDLASFKKETSGKRVLVVGHSNTTPALANTLLGNYKYQMISDDINGNLYIVTLSKSEQSATLLHLE